MLVFVHGGGLCGGDAGCFQGICSRLANATGRPVLIPHYRLCPEATKEDAVEDLIEFLLGVPDASETESCGFCASRITQLLSVSGLGNAR